MRTFLIISLVFSLNYLVLHSQQDNIDKKSYLNQTLINDNSFLDINNIGTVLRNNGISDIDVNQSNAGFIYPKFSGKISVFTSGLLWGTFIPGDPQVRVGGTVFRTGLQPGKITNGGLPWEQLTAEDINAPHVRTYRVRRDVYPGGPTIDLSDEATFEGKTVAEIRTNYETDWTEWRAEDGAPFEDVNSNGTYEPAIDIPGYPGADQTIWFVANDLDPSLTQFMYGANPIGVEVQVTAWMYHQSGILDNIIFKKYRLVNKTNNSFDDMYLSYFTDADIGNSINDFAGCDSILQFGYIYNATNYDPIYGYTPSGIGINLVKAPNNKPMTAFYYFARGDASVLDPIQGDIQGSTQFYNFMRGRIGLTGGLFTDPYGNQTTFALPGDPISNTGWIDGQYLSRGDRRMGISTGPFNVAAGDTLEIVISEVAALGFDNINAIRLLRYYSILSKELYENSFDMTRTPFPPKPIVSASQQDDNIIINWDNTAESFSKDSFDFQGYNVYQLASEIDLKSNAKRIATFDIIDGVTQILGTVMNPVTGYPEPGIEQYGSDSGIEHQLSIDHDWINNQYLIPGKNYYFAVTSYAYNSEQSANPNNTESLLGVVHVTFISDSIINYGSFLEVTHSQGQADGSVKAFVVDGYQLTGHTYKISFDTLFNGNKVWNLTDETTQSIILSDQTDFSGSENTSPIADGMQIRIKDAYDFKRFSMTENGNGPITEIVGFDETPPPLFNAYSTDWYRDVQEEQGGSLILPNGMQVAGGYFFSVAGGSTISTYLDALGRWTRDGSRNNLLAGNNYEIRFTSDGGYAWMAFSTRSLVQVPFELWYLGNTLDDTSDDVRMMPWIFDDNTNDVFDFKLDHLASSDDNDPYCDWIYFMMPNDHPQPGKQDYLDLVAAMIPDPTNWPGDVEVEHLARFVLMNFNQLQGNGGEDEMPEEGTIIRIEFGNPLTPYSDEYLIDQTTDVQIISGQPKDYELLQNYPNPFNPITTIKFELPERSNIKLSVYNTLGEEIRELINSEMNEGKYEVEFNGKNLASGIYFYTLKAGNKFFQVKKMVLLK